MTSTNNNLIKFQIGDTKVEIDGKVHNDVQLSNLIASAFREAGYKVSNPTPKKMFEFPKLTITVKEVPHVRVLLNTRMDRGVSAIWSVQTEHYVEATGRYSTRGKWRNTYGTQYADFLFGAKKTDGGKLDRIFPTADKFREIVELRDSEEKARDLRGAQHERETQRQLQIENHSSNQIEGLKKLLQLTVDGQQVDAAILAQQIDTAIREATRATNEYFDGLPPLE